MKTLLIVLLTASVIANVVLALKTGTPAALTSSERHSPEKSGDVATAATTKGEGSSATAPRADKKVPMAATTPAISWHTANTDQELHSLVGDLRAAGYPASVVRAIVNQLLNERFAPRQPNANQPFWKQSSPNAETVAAQIALSNERQALFEALLGPDARPSARLDSTSRERRYGAMPDEKIDAIAKIERDYEEMSAEAWAKRRGNVVTSSESMQQSRQLMEKERLADISAVLTPEELVQYEMRNSSSSRTLISNLRDIEISGTEFARLYEAQKSFDDANPMSTAMDGSSYAQRKLAQLALNEKTRAVIGDTRFYSYLESADRNYATAAKTLAKFPAVTPATTYQVYQLQLELQNLMSQSSQAGRPTPEKIAGMQTVVASYNAKLEALIGPEAATAYRSEGVGRAFSVFRTPPKTAPPSGG